MKLAVACIATVIASVTLRIIADPVSVPKEKLANKCLRQDLQDFMELMPQEQLLDSFYQHFTEDEDFRETLFYILSTEFKATLYEAETMTDVIDWLTFLQRSGIDAFGYVNVFNKMLGLPSISPGPTEGAEKITGGMPRYIEDIKAILQIERIEKLYDEKIRNSEEFALLITILSSSEFLELVDRLRGNFRLQDLLKIAKDKGIDILAIIDFIRTAFGLNFDEHLNSFNVSTSEV